MNYYHVIGKSYYKCTWRLQREQSGGMRMGWDAVSKGSWRICGLHVENWIRDYKMKKRENNDINNNSTCGVLARHKYSIQFPQSPCLNYY